MPSLFRFLFVLGLLSAITFGGLYLIGEYFEPESKQVVKVLPGVKIRR
jgi:hypothetical protein